jgi:superfamily II DNA/RNA helicase
VAFLLHGQRRALAKRLTNGLLSPRDYQALVGDNLAAQQALLRDEPDVLIATPSRLLTHLQAGNISLKESVQTLGAWACIKGTRAVGTWYY